jgi:hypothetical protein
MDFPLLVIGLSTKISLVPGKSKKKKALQVFPGVKIFVKHSCMLRGMLSNGFPIP